jgi:hypothetical protein
MPQADRDISHLAAKFLPFCTENQNYALWKLFATPCCLYLKSKCFRFLPYPGTISLQAPCQIFVEWLAWLKSPISYSINSVVQIHIIYSTSQSVLLLFMFISLQNILIPLTRGHSGLTIPLLQRDDRYPL